MKIFPLLVLITSVLIYIVICINNNIFLFSNENILYLTWSISVILILYNPINTEVNIIKKIEILFLEVLKNPFLGIITFVIIYLISYNIRLPFI